MTVDDGYLEVAADSASRATAHETERTKQARVVVGFEHGLRDEVELLCRGFVGEAELSYREGEPTGLRQAVLDHRVDVLLSRQEVPYRQQRQGLRSLVIARRALVPVVHADNPVATLAFAQLGSILDGRSRTWFEWNRNPAAIEVLALSPSNPRQTVMMERFWPTRRPVTTDAFASDNEVLAAVEGRPSSIALVDALALEAYRKQRGGRLKPLSIDNIPASLSTSKDGRWPLSWNILWITQDRPGTSEVAALTQYVTTPSNRLSGLRAAPQR